MKEWTIEEPTAGDLDMPDCSSAPDPAGDEYDPTTDPDNDEVPTT